MKSLRPSESALLWHKKWGHVDMKRVQKLIHEKMGVGLPESIITAPFVCETCHITKSTRSRTLGRTGRDPGTLEVVVSDVMGPFPLSYNAHRYVVTLRDVKTTYTDIALLKHKSEVAENVKRMVEEFEKESKHKVHTL